MSSALPSDSAPSVHPEGFFDFLLEKTPDQVYFKDRHGRFLRASRAVAEMLGVASAEDLIGKTDFDLWSAETAREAAAHTNRGSWKRKNRSWEKSKGLFTPMAESPGTTRRNCRFWIPAGRSSGSAE
jgi:PAS domain S-box-containing protein